MTHRCFSASPITTSTVSLGGPEAHHLLHVMRATPGSEVILFDNSGREFRASVVCLRRTEVELSVLSSSEIDREPNYALTMGIALPKGDRQKWLVQKLVELGVTELVPLRTSRAVAQPVSSALERLERTVIEASKQCGRNRLMQIRSPLSLEDYLAYAPERALRWLAHTDGSTLARNISGELGPGGSARLAIGPEGGFANEEVALARSSGWHVVRLGPRMLRIETAAVALASWFSLWLEDLTAEAT